jgi:hypothetical protein
MNIYLVGVAHGEYEDYRTEVLAACAIRSRAEEVVAKLKTLAKDHRKQWIQWCRTNPTPAPSETGKTSYQRRYDAWRINRDLWHRAFKKHYAEILGSRSYAGLKTGSDDWFPFGGSDCPSFYIQKVEMRP